MNKKSKKAVLITGAAKRIGRELALHFADKGCDIAIHYHQSDAAAAELKKDILSKGVQAEIFQADLATPSPLNIFFDQVMEFFPQLDVLINNASVFVTTDFMSCKKQEWHRDFQVHLEASFRLSQLFAGHIQKGSIINILDAAIVKSDTRHFSYLMAKRGLEDLTQLTARAAAPGILVNAVAPGYILEPEEGGGPAQKRIDAIPLRKKGIPLDVVHAVDFLVNHDFITGQTLFVDGGEHLL